MTYFKVNKRSLMAVVLVLVLFSGNTIILRYLTPLLYFVGLFSILWGNRKQLHTNRYIKRIVSLYSMWIFFLIINSIQSYDIKASMKLMQVFALGGILLFFSWREKTVQTYIRMIRIFCLFFAFSILFEVIAPNFILSLSYIIAPGRDSVILDEINRGIYSGLTGEKAKAAYAMVVGVCAELSFCIISEKKFSKINYLFVVIYVLAAMLTGKRMLCIIILLEIGVALYLFDFKGKIVKIILGGAIAIIVLYAITITIPQTSNIIARFIEGSEDTSAGGRLMFWNYCIVMFKNKPLVGYGINSFNKVFAENVGYLYNDLLWNMYAHSMYYELLGEAGIIGMVLFGIFMIYSLGYSIKIFKNGHISNIWRGLLLFSISMQVLFIVYGYSGNVLYDKAQLFTYLSSISMLIAVNYNITCEEAD